jgi:hypothetical protein
MGAVGTINLPILLLYDIGAFTISPTAAATSRVSHRGGCRSMGDNERAGQMQNRNATLT